MTATDPEALPEWPSPERNSNNYHENAHELWWKRAMFWESRCRLAVKAIGRYVNNDSAADINASAEEMLSRIGPLPDQEPTK